MWQDIACFKVIVTYSPQQKAVLNTYMMNAQHALMYYHKISSVNNENESKVTAILSLRWECPEILSVFDFVMFSKSNQ